MDSFFSLRALVIPRIPVLPRACKLLMCISLGAIMLSTGCSSTKKITMAESATPVIVPSKDTHCKSRVVEEAYTWVGTPYKYASAEKGVGTDCSGFVMKVYETAEGYKLPRNSAKQAEYCNPVKSESVQEGDLVFFATGKDPNQVSHVGIMINEEKFIHASSSKGVVVSNLFTPYFQTRLLMFGRVPNSSASR